MDSTLYAIETDLVVVLLAMAPVALIAYGSMALRFRREGGAVRAGGFVFADLLVAIVLAAFFCILLVQGWSKTSGDPAPIKIDQVLPSSLMLLFIAAVIGGFLIFRGGDLIEILGIKRLPPLRIAGNALLFYVTLLPIVFVTNLITTKLLKESAQEQQLVALFRNEAGQGHYSALAKIFFAGVVLAPVVEEFLFRGYFYGVFKRHIGAFTAALLSAGLFAAFHMNLASLPGLFALAMCFTIAYERTGSIFVPIGMHALFNFSNLALLYAQSHVQHP